jgi:peptidoglycan hydrolase-like protein with peptidoglycan-binding domain
MRARFWGKYSLVLPLFILSGCAQLDKTGLGESSDGATEQALQGKFARPDTSAMVPETSRAGDDEPISNLDADVIRSVQAALNGRGFGVGRPDGRIGAQTIRGIRLFKVARRMPVTDAITSRLLSELAVPQR